MQQDKRRVWRVREMDRRGSVVQDRYTPAINRKEAKELYDRKGYRRYPHTKLTAIVIGDMSQWAGED